MDETPKAPHPLVGLLAQALIGAQAASAPHLATLDTEQKKAIAGSIHAGLKPLLDELIGNAMAAVDPNHPASKMWDSPDPLGAPPTLPPIDTGGVLGEFEDFLLTLLGILGAALGILPALGEIINQPFISQIHSAYPNVPLDVASLADMAERNILSDADAAAEALLSGVDGSRFDLLIQNTGEPPGIAESLELVLRGAMSDDEFERILYYSRVRNEFLPFVKQMAYHQMGKADAIELALKQVVSNDVALQYFKQAGGIESEWTALLAAAGNPIGTVGAANLLAHGVIDKARFDQVVAHSRINPEFTDLAADTHLKWLTPFQIHQAVGFGAIDAKTATQWLIEDGYDATQAAAFAGGSAKTKTVSHKAETEAMIVSEYQAKLVTQDQATSMLEALGYDAGEVTLILDLAQAKLIIAQRNQAVSKIRTLFTTGKISKTLASNDLDTIGIPASARDQYLAFWELEHGTIVKEFTTAQIGSFLKKGIITQPDAVQRWEQQGWSDSDAALLAADYTGTKAATSGS